LCENRCEKKTRDQKREKTEKKEDRKKRQKIASLEASEKNESKKRLTSPYIYTHTSLRTESVHNREGTLSLSLSLLPRCFCIYHEISTLSLSPRRRRRRKRRG